MDLEEEGENLTEEEKREIEQDESHAGSTMLEGSFSIANSRMWMLGLSHILTRKISVGYNFEQSLVPVRQARIDRKKHNFMVRHDVSKETSTRVSYSLTHRHCAQNAKFNGLEHEAGFKLTQRPKRTEDESKSVMSFL